MLETLVAIGVGLGLAAACGLRVFLPMWFTSLAATFEVLPLGEGFEWLATVPALTALSLATVLEVAAYYIPWVDNALDTVATPLASIAGVLLMASVLVEMDPLLRWSLAIIAGGGSATVIQGTTVAIRGGSTLATAGIANWIFSTIEWIGAIVMSLLALFIPLLALLLVTLLVAVIMRRLFRRRLNKPTLRE